MALRELISWRARPIWVTVKYKRGKLPRGRGSSGICAGQVALWLADMLTKGADWLDVSRASFDWRATFIHAKWLNRFESRAYMDPGGYATNNEHNQGLMADEIIPGMLADAGLRVLTKFQSVATVITPEVVGRSGGYLISTGTHVVGFVTDIQNSNFYFYDPNAGVFTTQSLDDLTQVDDAIRGLYGANLNSFHFRWMWQILWVGV
jgi:hypothetical protein